MSCLSSKVARFACAALATCATTVAIAQQPPQPTAPRSPATRETWLSANPNTTPAPGVWRIRPTVSEYLAEEKSGKLEKEVLLITGGQTAWMWNEQKWFPEYRTINRGFGGASTNDLLFFTDEMIIPRAPSTILLYEENDITPTTSPQQALERIEVFVGKIHAALPATQIVIVSLRPSPRRWEVWPQMKELNALLKAYAGTDARLDYVDTTDITLGSDGKLLEERFIVDKWHLNEDGYKLYTDRAKPAVARAEARYRQLKKCDRCGALKPSASK